MSGLPALSIIFGLPAFRERCNKTKIAPTVGYKRRPTDCWCVLEWLCFKTRLARQRYLVRDLQWRAHLDSARGEIATLQGQVAALQAQVDTLLSDRQTGAGPSDSTQMAATAVDRDAHIASFEAQLSQRDARIRVLEDSL